MIVQRHLKVLLSIRPQEKYREGSSCSFWNIRASIR
jgi:hypothetical protein